MMYLHSQGRQQYEKNSKSIPEIIKSKNEKNILNFEKIKKLLRANVVKNAYTKFESNRITRKVFADVPKFTRGAAVRKKF